MKIEKDMTYKVVEMEHCLVIVPAMMQIKPDATTNPLIIADALTIPEYLIRYLTERENGKPWQEAHAKALEGANIHEIIRRQ